MTRDYDVVERPADGVRFVQRTDWDWGDRDTALWSLGKLRKSAKCAATGRKLDRGEEVWRPVGNQQYRSERLSIEVLQ